MAPELACPKCKTPIDAPGASQAAGNQPLESERPCPTCGEELRFWQSGPLAGGWISKNDPDPPGLDEVQRAVNQNFRE